VGPPPNTNARQKRCDEPLLGNGGPRFGKVRSVPEYMHGTQGWGCRASRLLLTVEAQRRLATMGVLPFPTACRCNVESDCRFRGVGY
jgi:hypothetical protein